MVFSKLYDDIGKSYEATLAELSDQFWAGVGNRETDIAYDASDQSEDIELPPSMICNAPHSSIPTPVNTVSTNGPIVVNGITLSEVTVRQLRQLGLPLDWYTSDELEDAVKACAVDATLVDDPHGHTFQDKLSLEAHEKDEHHDIPTLHGFHKDEYEHIMAGFRSRSRKRLKTAVGAYERDKAHIDEGLRMLCNPCHVSDGEHYGHGLEAAPHKQQETHLTLAA